MTKYVLVTKYETNFVYARINCHSKKFDCRLGTNTILFHVASNDLYTKLSKKYCWTENEPFYLDDIVESICSHMKHKVSARMARMVMENIKDGMTGVDIGHICGYENDEFYAFVTGYSDTIIRYAPGTNPRKAFDYIDIFAHMNISLPYKYQLLVAKQYKDKIIEDALFHIENTGSFLKYGIPTKYLHLDRMVLKKDCTLYLLFSVKHLPKI